MPRPRKIDTSDVEIFNIETIKPQSLPKIFKKLVEAEITHFDAGYRRFAFIFSKNLVVSGEKCWGVTDFDKCTIFLGVNMYDETAQEVLLHEITHVLLEIVGLGGGGSDEVSDELPHHPVINNEYITTLISRVQLMSIRLNPRLYKILAALA